MSATQDQPHCYICLGNGDEIPPLGTIEDSKEWIKPCTCSFTAHKRCFYSWLSSLELERRRRGEDDDVGNNQFQNNNNNNNINNNNNGLNINQFHTTLTEQLDRFSDPQSSANQIVSFSLGSTSSLLSDSVPEETKYLMKCLQCRGPIMVTMNRSKILSYKTAIEQIGANYLKVGLISTLASCTAASVAFGATSLLSATGIRMISTIIPISVQSTIFNYNNRNLSLLNAVDRGLVTIPNFLAQTSVFPIGLFYLRHYKQSYNFAINIFTSLIPIGLLSSHSYILKNNPSRWLFYSLPGKYLYNIAFGLTFNRIYYKWCKRVQPCFIADRLSLKELDQIESENKEEYEYRLLEANIEKTLQEEKTQNDKVSNSNINNSSASIIIKIFKKLLTKLTPSARLFAIGLSRFKREIICCLKNDYSVVFQSQNIYVHFGTTLIWPYFGELLSRTILTKIPYIKELTNTYASTPAEALFLTNLYGCIVVVLIKDLFNLYLNYKKYQQYVNLHVESHVLQNFRSS